jgi:osomolarity two-component system response regulator SSK1
MGLSSVPVGGASVLSNAGNFGGHPSLVGGRQQEFGVMGAVANIGASMAGVPGGGVGPDENAKQAMRALPGGTGPDDGRPSLIVGSPPPGSSPPLMISSRLLSKKPKKQMGLDSLSPPPPGAVNNGVPPINVLIVEDNPINLKLLEAFVKRLKVRWKTAMNGRDAVAKWRGGGFHLVLMDIQLPVMNGLEATREIRRLERVNSIGIFTSSSSSPLNMQQQQLLLLPGQVSEDDNPVEQDKLKNPEMFKSPVIIVALTASSLQSDRHEALAAGCNDFLTKVIFLPIFSLIVPNCHSGVTQC